MGNSVLCNKHFEENCFEPGTNIAAQFRFNIKLTRKVKPDAVSSILYRKRSATTDSLVHNVALVSQLTAWACCELQGKQFEPCKHVLHNCQLYQSVFLKAFHCLGSSRHCHPKLPLSLLTAKNHFGKARTVLEPMLQLYFQRFHSITAITGRIGKENGKDQLAFTA